MNLKQVALKPIWGISEVSKKLHVQPTILEIQPTFEHLKTFKRGKCTLAFSFWYLNGEDTSEQWERDSTLLEFCKFYEAQACVVNVPPSIAQRPDLPKKLDALIDRCFQKSNIPIYFDFGKSGPPSWFNPRYCVSDPLWHHGTVFGDYWKIHGWHTERWVRLYSKADLEKLIQWADRYQPSYVIFAHSQRYEQWLSCRERR